MNTHPLVDRILAPIDGSPLSEQAIPYALALAAPSGVVTLLRVVPRPEAIQDPLGGVLMTEQEVLARYRVLAGEEVVAAMARWRARARARMEVGIVVGDPAEEILRAAQERAAGMIVLASRGHGTLGRLALGSVADRVSRAAEVPVVVVRPEDALPDPSQPLVRRLVVPLDGSPRSRSAVPVARSLALALRAGIHLVSVVDFARAAPAALTYGAAFSQALYDEVMAGVESEAAAILEQERAALAADGIAASWAVLTGAPAAGIIGVAKRGDIVVLTSHGRGGFKRWLLGSVAEKLVRHSPVPVAIVPARPALLPAEQPVAAHGGRAPERPPPDAAARQIQAFLLRV